MMDAVPPAATPTHTHTFTHTGDISGGVDVNVDAGNANDADIRPVENLAVETPVPTPAPDSTPPFEAAPALAAAPLSPVTLAPTLANASIDVEGSAEPASLSETAPTHTAPTHTAPSVAAPVDSASVEAVLPEAANPAEAAQDGARPDASSPTPSVDVGESTNMADDASVAHPATEAAASETAAPEAAASAGPSVASVAATPTQPAQSGPTPAVAMTSVTRGRVMVKRPTLPLGLAAVGPAPISSNGAVIPVAPVFERFHSFKEFIALQKDSLEPERAVDLYDQYKYDFKLHSARTVFLQNLQLGFIRSRYDALSVATVYQEKQRLAKELAQTLFKEVEGGKYADLRYELSVDSAKLAANMLKPEPRLNGRVTALLNINSAWTKADANATNDMKDTNEGNEGRREGKSQGQSLPTDLTVAPYYGVNLNESECTLVLKKLPAEIMREDLVELCKDLAGLVSISLVPSCLLEDHQSSIVMQANKPLNECTPEEIAAIERSMSECYLRSRSNGAAPSVLLPLQTAWLTFDTEEHTLEAETALERRPIRDICACAPLRVRAHSAATRRLRVCSAESSTRQRKDHLAAQQLIVRLDQEFRVFDSLPLPPYLTQGSDGGFPTSSETSVAAAGGASAAANAAAAAALDVLKADEKKEDMNMGDGTKEDGGKGEAITVDSRPVTKADLADLEIIDESGHEDRGRGKQAAPEAAAPLEGPALEAKMTEMELSQMIQSHPYLQLVRKKYPGNLLRQLDHFILYLRQVHFCDFYSGKICFSARELYETCGMCTVRLSFGDNDDTSAEEEGSGDFSGAGDVVALSDLPAYLKLQPADELSFNRRVSTILQFHFSLLMSPLDFNHPVLSEIWAVFCKSKTIAVEAEKFRCGICRKLFKAPEYVYKHLKNKHPEELVPVQQATREALMKEAFEAEDAKLLLFVIQTNDFLKVFQNLRPPQLSFGADSAYGPQRRASRNNRQGGPGEASKPYRDWDAPRMRLEEKSAGGNYRRIITYDDL